jgi:hypothetical protein
VKDLTTEKSENLATLKEESLKGYYPVPPNSPNPTELRLESLR